VGDVGPRVRTLDEAEIHVASLTARILELERLVSDHAQRFDTLQTPWWRRLWFAIDGWPWYDLNAPGRAWRPWRGLLPDRLIERLD
jgi:hypothetical protein